MANLAPTVSAIASATVPGADVVLNLVKNIWELYERIKEIKGLGNVCRALIERVDLLAKQLEGDRAKLDVNSAIVAVLIEYIKTVKEFKVCLEGWIKTGEEHRFSKAWRLKNVPDRIKEFDVKISKLHEDLNYAHIVEMEEWMQTDSKWKKQLKCELNQLGDQVTDEHDKTRDHTTEEHDKTRDHTSAGFNSLLNFIQPKKKDIDQLVHILENVGDEAKDELLSELWDQCVNAKENEAIPGLLALMKYGSSDERLLAAKKLSKLAKTHRHDIIARDGDTLLMKLAREASPDQMKPIFVTLGAIYYISKVKMDLDAKQIVQPLMLVLRHENSNKGEKMMAAGVLRELSRVYPGRMEIDEQNGISALLDTIRNCGLDPVDQKRKTHALGALEILSRFEDYQPKVAEAISELLRLLKTSEESQKELVLDILMNLSNATTAYRSKFADANGFQLLCNEVEFVRYSEYVAKPYEVQALELLWILDEIEHRECGSGDLVAEYRWYIHNMEPQRAANKAIAEYPQYHLNVV